MEHLIISKAYAAFVRGDYAEALDHYFAASQLLGKDFVHANISVAKTRHIERMISILRNRDKPPKRRIVELMASLPSGSRDLSRRKMLQQLSGSMDPDELQILADSVESRSLKLQSFTPQLRKKMLIVGHDLRFAAPFIRSLKEHFDVTVLRTEGVNEINIADAISHSTDSDIVWCEWCCANAVWFSHNKRPDTKLLVRFHRFEHTTQHPQNVDWSNVDSLIFIAHGIREKAVEKFGIDCNSGVLYNSFDIDNFLLESDKNHEKNIHSLAMIGYIPSLKRPDLALDLLNSLNDTNPRFTLSFKGKHPSELPWVSKNDHNYYKSFFSRVDVLNSADQRIPVQFEGYDDNVATWMSRKGFLISASDIEGSHQAVAEAMSAGTVPVIIGRWAKDYSAGRMYPRSLIFNDIISAKNFILRTLESGRYETLSQEVQRFALDNFSPETVMHSCLQLISTGVFDDTFVPCEPKRHVGILSDLNPNVIDGSSVWLESIAELLLSDPHTKITLFSKTELQPNSTFQKFTTHPRAEIACFPCSYDPVSFTNFVESKSQAIDIFVVRASTDLLSALADQIPKILNRSLLYIVDELPHESPAVDLFLGLIAQTNINAQRVLKALPEASFSKPIAVLPPMIPSHYKPKYSPPSGSLKVVYAGKMCRDYMSLEMCEYAARKDNKFRFSVIASKFYRPDGDDYVRETKRMLGKAVAAGLTKQIGPLTRDQTREVILESDVGWLVRDQKFENSPEISTKLLEYCALGKPVFANRFLSNISLLGADYPLFVDSTEDLAAHAERLLNEQGFYEKVAQYCAHVSRPYMMKASLDRIAPLIFSTGDPIPFPDHANSFENFCRYFDFYNHELEERGITLDRLDAEWKILESGEDVHFRVNVPANCTNANVSVVFDRIPPHKPAMVVLYRNEVNVTVAGWATSSTGESFAYVPHHLGKFACVNINLPENIPGSELNVVLRPLKGGLRLLAHVEVQS